MLVAASSAVSFLLDLCFGDPVYRFHPIRVIGRLVQKAEPTLRRVFPKTERGELLAGALCALSVSGGTFLFFALVLWGVWRLHPAAAVVLNILFGWQSLACKDLLKETSAVYDAFAVSLDEARSRVSRIVGRDTEALSEEGVIKASVETTAESLCDGIVAPLFYLMIGGAPLAFFYKAVNTMDSMIGYRNETYLYFGRPAARMDDVLNYLPARIAALFLILSTGLRDLSDPLVDAKEARRIWKRDRRKHKSPNSAQTEAAMAGALGVKLAGPASYFGRLEEKPYIGDGRREICREDILRANRLTLTAAVLGLLVLAAARVGICFLTVYVLQT